MSLPRKAEVVIIGGGIVGAAISYYLAKEGVRPLLIEKNDIASGASARNSGAVIVQSQHSRFDAIMTQRSLLLYKELAKELDYDFDYEERDSLLIAETQKECKFLCDRFEKQRAEGLPVEKITRDQILKNYPVLAENIGDGIKGYSDVLLNPMRATFALIDRVKKLGGQIQTFTKVNQIELDRNNIIRSVVTSRGEVKTSIVVNAAGAWASEIGTMINLQIPVIPEKGQLLVTESLPPLSFPMAFPMIDEVRRAMDVRLLNSTNKYNISFTFQQTRNGNLLLGGTREFAGFDTTTNLGVIKKIAERAVRFLPVLRNINIIRSFAGLRPYTLDRKPIVCKVDKFKDFYVATGHGGRGVCLAPVTGKVISELITKGSSSVSVKSWHLSRFKKEFKPDQS